MRIDVLFFVCLIFGLGGCVGQKADIVVINYDAKTGMIRSYTLLNGDSETNESAHSVQVGKNEKQIIFPLEKLGSLSVMQCEVDEETGLRR